MPSLTRHRLVLHAALIAAVLVVPARAATLTWGTSGTGGTGTWATTGGWWDGTSMVDWNSSIPDNAVFAGTAGTVTLNTDFTAGALTFNTSGYFLTGNTLTLAGAAPSITMGTNVSGTIASILAGSSGLTTSGAGSLLTLTAGNTYTGTTTISSGTIRLGNGGTTGSLSATGTINGSSGAGLAFNRSNSITQGTDFGTLIGGSINVSQIGSGTVTLNAANTYAGSTTISAGRLSLSGGNNRLPTTTSLTMSGGTLDVGSTSQSITNFAATNGTIVGSGTLSVNSASGGVQNVNLSSLARFSYDAGTNGVNFTAQSGGGSGVVTLSATSNYIRAGTVNVTVQNTTGATTGGSLFFGTENTLYANTLTVAYGTENRAIATFAGGLTNPSLTIRAQNGTGRAEVIVGYQNNNTFRTTSGTLNTESGSLDALVGTMTIGRGHTTNSGQGTGVVIMGTGTLDATTITMASANVQNAQGTMRVSGGTVIVGTLNMGLKGSTGTPTASFTLQNDGAIEATTITAPSSGATSTFTWNAGTIRNKSGGNLTINSGITTFNVATSGSHVFDIGAGRSGSVAANMSGVGRITSVGSGTLTLSGSNSYSGGTRITAGRLILGSSNALGSTSGSLSVDGGTLDLGTQSPTVGVLSGSAGGTITTSGVAAVTLSASSGTGTTTFAGAIQNGSGTVGLTKLGTGMLVLSGSNTYTGTTTISAGTVLFDAVAALYGGTSVDWTADRLITGAGDVAAFTVGAASPQFTATDLDTILGMASTASTGFLDGSAIGINVGSGTSFSYGTAIVNPNGGANSLGLVKLGDGTLTLSASNSYSGGTQLAAGLMNFADVNAFGTGTVTFTASATLQAGTAGTFANAIAIASGAVGTFDNQSNAATLSGPISGSGSLVKVGDGTLTLSASNSYSGGTQIAAGMVNYGSVNAFGTGTVAFTGGATLQAGTVGTIANAIMLATGVTGTFDSQSNATTLSGVISGSGGFTKVGDGTLTLSATSTYTGTTTITTGTLQVGDGTTGALAASSPITGLANATLAFNRGTALTVANSIDGGIAVVQLGTGTLTLSGNNSYTGTTRINAGTLSLGGMSALAGSTLDMNSNDSGNLAFGVTGTNTYTIGGLVGSRNIATSGSVVLAVGANAASGTYAGVISGAGAFTKVGSGTLTLSGSNTYTGTTSINAGTLQIGDGTTGALSGSSAITGLAGGVLAFNRADGLVLGNTIGGGIGVTQFGTGTLTLSASNSYSGNTTIAAGVVAFGNPEAFGTGTVSFTGPATLLTGTTGTLANAITIATGVTGTFDGQSTIATLSGPIIGSGGFVKVGAGTLTLSGSNTYAGPTRIDVGTLLFDNVSALYGDVTSSWTAANLVTGGGGVAAFTVGATNPQFTSADLDIILGMASTASTGFLDGSAIGMNVGSGTSFIYGSLIANPNGGANSLGLVKLGAGTLTLSASNSYGGGTQIAAGVVNFGGLNALGTGTVSFTGGATLQAGTTGTLANAIAIATGVTGTFDGQANANTLSGEIIGQGTFVKAGAGTLTLSASNSYSGGTQLRGGVVNFRDLNTFGTGTVSFAAASTLQSGTAGELGNAITIASGVTGTFDSQSNSNTLTGLIGGSGGLVKAGVGTLTLTAANTYGGATTLSAGRLALSGGNNRLPTTTSLTMSSGTLDVGSTSQTITNFTASNGTVVGSGTLAVSAASGGLQNVTMTNLARFSYDAGSAAVNFGGQSTGQSGTVILSATSNFIRAGTMQLPFQSTSSGGQTNGTLSLGGSNTLNIDTISVGWGVRAFGTIQFAAGLTNPAVTIRSQNGTGRATINIGWPRNSGFTAGGTVDTGAGSIDALVGTLTIGRGGDSTGFGLGVGTFTMGTGTLDATTIFLGQSVNSAFGDGTMQVSGGTVIVDTFNFGSRSSTGGASGNFTMQTNAALRARTLVPGSGATANFTWNSGTIGNKSGGNLTINSGFTSFNVATSGSHVFDIESGRSGSVAANMSGVGRITSVGSGTLTLSGSNSYSGGTRMTAGRLVLGNANALGSASGALAVDGGTLDLGTVSPTVGSLSGSAGGTITTGSATNASLIVNTTGTATYGGTIADGSGTVSLVKSGAGRLVLDGSNAYSGGTTLNAGSLELGDLQALGSGTTSFAGNGTVRLDVAGTLATPFTFAPGVSGTFDTNGLAVALSGPLTGDGGLATTGAGSLTIAGTTGYTGETLISGGTLAVTGGGSVASSPRMNIGAGGVLDISAASGVVTIGTLAGSGSAILGGNTLRSVVASNPDSFAGVISGSGGFTKAGGGELTLSAIQAFSGQAAVEEGVLFLTQADRLQSAASIFLAEGTALNGANGLTVFGGQSLGGYGTVEADVIFNANSILSPGGSVGQLDTTGNVTFNGPMSYTFDLNDANGAAGGPDGWDLYTATGAMTFSGFGGGNTFTVNLVSLSGTAPGLAADFDANGNYAWKFLVSGTNNTITYSPSWFMVATSNFQNLSTNPERFTVVRGDELGPGFPAGSTNELYVVYAAVPEPGSLALAGLGLASLAGAVTLRRRRRRSGD